MKCGAPTNLPNPRACLQNTSYGTDRCWLHQQPGGKLLIRMLGKNREHVRLCCEHQSVTIEGPAIRHIDYLRTLLLDNNHPCYAEIRDRYHVVVGC